MYFTVLDHLTYYTFFFGIKHYQVFGPSAPTF